jgi:glycerol uptake facilitator-like aquaporin
LKRAVAAEFIGSAFLAMAVIGSGIAGENLSGGNTAIALLANSIATGAVLFGIIQLFGGISGAHFNPAVSLAFALQGELPWRHFGPYAAAQTLGMIVGVLIAHAMFDLSLVQQATKVRSGAGLALAESVATFGLILLIIGLMRGRKDAIPAAVALYILGAYWFTASTSFANPAITIARSLSDTFAGIALQSVPAFVIAQVIGAIIAAGVTKAIWPGTASTSA